jgi:hypothetical protein
MSHFYIHNMRTTIWMNDNLLQEAFLKQALYTKLGLSVRPLHHRFYLRLSVPSNFSTM